MSNPETVEVRLDRIEEVFAKASEIQADLNSLIHHTDLDHQDIDDIEFNLEIIRRRVDPATWKDYDE